MIVIKYKNNVITPMPPQGRFSDETFPNCSATDCCLIKASRVLGLPTPALTENEIAEAVQAQLAIRGTWTEKFTVSDYQVVAKRDDIRGFTDQQVHDYIVQNSYELVDGVRKAKTPPTIEAAKAALLKKVANPITRELVPVVVPSDASIKAALQAEMELDHAKSIVQKMIDDGFLVTANIPDEFRDQFEIVAVE